MNKKELKYYNDMLLDVLWQALGEKIDGKDVIFHRFISAYQDALIYLEGQGYLKTEDDCNYEIIGGTP